jgi:hypothetical protein
MSFKDCIDTAVADGRLAASKATVAKQAFDDAIAEGLATGLTQDIAEQAAGLKALEQVTNLTKQKRWERLNDLKRANALHNQIATAANPIRALDEVIELIDLRYKAISGQAMASLDQFILKYMPKWGGLHLPQDGLDDIVAGTFGKAVTPEGKATGQAVLDVRKHLAKRANLAGANIDIESKTGMPQSHDRLKVKAVPEQEWVQDHLRTLDWSVMRFNRKPIPVEMREEVLKRTYEGIVTHGKIRLEAGQAENRSLVSQLNEDRFLWYAGPDEWLEMQGKYGRGNPHQQILGMIEAQSRDIAVLEVLGTNPSAMNGYVTRLANKRAAELQLEGKPIPMTLAVQGDWVSAASAKASDYLSQYDVVTNSIVNGEESFWIQSLSAVRTASSSLLLGAVFLSSVGDVAIGKWAGQFNRMPATKLIRNYLTHFVKGKMSAEEAMGLGIAFESGISMASALQRFVGPIEGPYWARRFSDVVYRAGLATRFTQTGKNVNGILVAQRWARDRHLPFSELPYAPALREMGITEADWNVFRNGPVYEKEGVGHLRPLDLWEKGTTEAERQAADKFANFLQRYVELAVPTTTVRARTALGAAIPATTLRGQFARTQAALASFPATIMFNHLSRILNMPTGVNDKLMQFGKLFLYLTLGGALVTQLKAIATGKDLHDMSTIDFWLRAAINGGSFGLAGDFVMNNINAATQGYSPSTPLEQQVSGGLKLTFGNALKMAKGEETSIGKDAYKFASGMVPKLWWYRVAMDRMMEELFLQEIDPAAYSRLQQKQQEVEAETGQGMWWGTGEDPRAPNVEVAFGQ